MNTTHSPEGMYVIVYRNTQDLYSSYDMPKSYTECLNVQRNLKVFWESRGDEVFHFLNNGIITAPVNGIAIYTEILPEEQANARWAAESRDRLNSEMCGYETARDIANSRLLANLDEALNVLQDESNRFSEQSMEYYNICSYEDAERASLYHSSLEDSISLHKKAIELMSDLDTI